LSGKKIEAKERLVYNNTPLANFEDVPEFEVLSQADYDAKKPEEIV
jgi:hypothetical protein